MTKIKGIKNFRDLGGLLTGDGRRVREGIIFRSGMLFKMKEKHYERLRKLGIKDNLDLRTPIEIAEKPDPAIEGINNIHIPIFTDSVLGITHETGSDYATYIRKTDSIEKIMNFIPDMKTVYGYVMTDENIIDKLGEALRRVIDNVIEHRVTLLHCSEGKDRAGALSALLLILLGVPEEDVYAEYELSNKALKPRARLNAVLVCLLKRNLKLSRRIWNASIADPDYIKTSFEVITQRYESLEAFLRDRLGIDDHLRERFRCAALV